MIVGGLDVSMLLDAIIFSGPAWIAALISWRNHREMKIPSGGKIGEMMERTHAQSSVAAAGVKTIADTLAQGDPAAPPNLPPGKPTL